MAKTINRMLVPWRERLHHREAIRREKTRMAALLLVSSLVARLCTGTGATDARDIYVTKAGSPAPAGGSSETAYQMVEAGIAAAKGVPGSTVAIESGKYYETFTATTPCTLVAPHGNVTIGKLDYQAWTTIELVTLNTHLFGDGPGPSWQDYERAEDISYFVRDTLSKSPDAVCFQEIWDEDLFLGGDDAGPGIYWRAQYPYGEHGTKTNCLCANSGLAIMSQLEMRDWKQVFWEYRVGVDGWASKGWVEVTIPKGPFAIRLFTLHTQAGNTSDARIIRAYQLRKLKKAIQEYRAGNPTDIVLVCGDFNIYGEEWEYDQWGLGLIAQVGIEGGGRDAARNSSLGFVVRDSEYYTYDPSNNRLAAHFDDDGSPDGRLDYIFYFPSLDGSVEVLPIDVHVEPFRGRTLTEDDLTTDESSDHYGLRGKFKLVRTKS